MNLDSFAKLALVALFNRALALVGGGLTAIGITTSDRTAELMAGVALMAIHYAIDKWNLKRAFNAVPWPFRPALQVPPAAKTVDIPAKGNDEK